ncbi:MAG: hypothetical protein GF349_02530 [Candidatus Magasanikbacteria bacterium]|nr:hypothetical protein [Candidatus Magasanikbacteria bacterium]
MTTHEILLSAGFDPSDAEIYQILAENGECSVPKIQEKTTLSRASIYDSLATLLAKDFIDYRKEGRNAYYKPNHPSRLFGLVEEKKQETAVFAQEMQEAIKQLTGAYNLAEKKPGVRFFEGEDGYEQALYDTLNTTDTLYTIVDLEAVQKYADKINKEYVEDRRKKGINKQILVVNTPANQEYLKKQGKKLTDSRLLPKNIKSFNTAMQIYNNKIAYFTLREDSKVAVIIEDPDIYNMQKNIFEGLWNLSKDKITPPDTDGGSTVFNG